MIANENKIADQLPFPIKETIIIRDITIVRVDDDKTHGSGDKSLNRNIWLSTKPK
jgi:hypothetical protein